jgi:hypothetical protein
LHRPRDAPEGDAEKSKIENPKIENRKIKIADFGFFLRQPKTRKSEASRERLSSLYGKAGKAFRLAEFQYRP